LFSKGEKWYDKLFNVKYLPLFHHFKAIYQFPKYIILLVKIVANAALKFLETCIHLYYVECVFIVNIVSRKSIKAGYWSRKSIKAGYWSRKSTKAGYWFHKSIKAGYWSHFIVNRVSHKSIKAGYWSHFIVNRVSRVYKGWVLISFYCKYSVS
jgi:hypothetical protein